MARDAGKFPVGTKVWMRVLRLAEGRAVALAKKAGSGGDTALGKLDFGGADGKVKDRTHETSGCGTRLCYPW